MKCTSELSCRGVRLPKNPSTPSPGTTVVAAWKHALIYIGPHNRDAAITTNVQPLQGTPYNLDGSGVIVRVRDAGGGRETHQEFGGRLTIMDTASLSSHATHVCGAIGSSGDA